MARRGVLGGFNLDLFGGGGVDASVFNIASQSKQNEAYLALTRVEVQWDAGKVSNADYLAALATYVQTFPADSAERLNQQSRLESTTYRIERNVLVSQVNAGSKPLTDLLAYDKAKLSGLNPDSQEYLDRQGRLFDTQGQVFNDEEKQVVASYSDGKMTTAQLQKWYQDRQADPRFAGNVELLKSVGDRVKDLGDRVVDERDSKMIGDYAAGKVTPQRFLAYAATARARYADGTTQAQEWDNRIETARDAAVEDDLAYRYGLSQQYQQLKQFIAQNGSAPKGGVSTSTRTTSRTVLGADGNWHVVKSTTTSSKPYAPSAAEQKAWQQRQVQVSEAKREMADITAKIGKLAGGWVTTDDMLGYYKRQLVRVARGSSEWYQIQSKIDGLNETKANERVLARSGIKISYTTVPTSGPERYKVPGTPASGGGGSSAQSTSSKPAAKSSNTSLSQFMSAIAKVESGGRYDARNSSSGAYGKYQILPSNWSSWAQKAGLPADAKPTPENQEKVVKNRMQALYRKYDGDYSKMAAEWFAGAAGSGNGNSSAWGPRTRAYVQKVMAAAGSSYSPGRTAGSSAPSYSLAGGGGGASGSASTATASSGGKKKSSGPPALKVITGVTYHAPPQGKVKNDAYAPQGFQQVTTRDIPLPTGLDARQFRAMYDTIEHAFMTGQEAAVIDVGGGKRMQVFIGDDPDERIATMRELDDLRINLADVEVKSYSGTGSGVQVAQRATAARKDAATHELYIMSANDPHGTPSKSNPVASAIRILDQTVSGVTSQVAQMNAAYERGDLTAAYLYAQQIQRLTDGIDNNGRPSVDIGNLVDLVNQADAKVRALVGRTGVKVPSVVQSDLDRLHNAITEIQKAAEPGAKTVTALDNFLSKDSSGQVQWTGSGPTGQVKLKADMIQVVTSSGKVEIKPASKTQVRDDGSVGAVVPDNMVPVMLKSGTSVISAYAQYQTGRVGFAILADGTRVPITGKIVSVPTDRNNDGVADGTSTYFENPLSPGKWSNTAIVYRAPTGTKVVYDQKGGTEPSLQFTAPDGGTVTLTSDSKTGVYQTWYQAQSGGPFAQPSDLVPLGTAGQNADVAKLLEGWTRDNSNANSDSLTDVGAPALGFTKSEWDQVTHPAVRPITHAPEITRTDLVRRATGAPTNAVKAGQMAVNADLARELIDEKRGVTRTPAGTNLKGPVVLTRLPTQKATPPPGAPSPRGPNANLMAIEDRFNGDKAGTAAGSASAMVAKKKATTKSTPRPAPVAKRTSSATARRPIPKPKPKPIKPLPTRSGTTKIAS